MNTTKRTTIYFESDLHRALRVEAAVSDRSISEIVNEAVRRVLAEDAADLAAIEQRETEPSLDFASLVRALRRRGRL